MNSPCVHRVNDVLRQSKKNNLVPSVSPVTGSPLDSHRTMFNYRMRHYTFPCTGAKETRRKIESRQSTERAAFDHLSMYLKDKKE